jgi:hypothetical protein
MNTRTSPIKLSNPQNLTADAVAQALRDAGYNCVTLASLSPPPTSFNGGRLISTPEHEAFLERWVKAGSPMSISGPVEQDEEVAIYEETGLGHIIVVEVKTGYTHMSKHSLSLETRFIVDKFFFSASKYIWK